MQFSRGAAVLTAMTVVTGGLAACGEDEPAAPTSTASPIEVDPSSSSSSDPTVSSSSGSSTDAGDELPADYPAAAREKTKEGAAAFGKYYYQALGEAGHTGRTDTLEELSLGSCPPCEQAIKDISAAAKKDQTRDENPYRFSGLQAIKRPDKGYKVSMDVQVVPHKVYEKGKVIGSVKATDYQLIEHVVWTDGRWQISDWVLS